MGSTDLNYLTVSVISIFTMTSYSTTTVLLTAHTDTLVVIIE